MGIFVQNNLYLGKTSVVKNKIKLKPDTKPFKDHYRCFPSLMYEEVHAHIQEVFDIWPMKPSQSSWAGQSF